VRRAISKHLRDFLAIVFLIITAAGVAGYVLSNQRFYLPGWVPVVGTEFYVVEAEFENAQAVVPGQGQTVNIAGVKVGDIGRVELEDGRAVVTLKIREKYRGRVFRDATILLRPKTGLKDMYLQLDPGTPAAGELPEGDRIPVSNTLPDVNPDEVLASLDQDTRTYLQVLLSAGGEALDGSGDDLRATLRRFEPTTRDVRAITGELAERRRNLRRVIHNFRLLAEELGSKDEQLAALVDSANANFEALARQDADLRAALRELPSTLTTTRDTLGSVEELAGELGPSLQALRPAARNLAPALREVRPFLRDSTPVIQRQLRPFARGARPEVRLLRRTVGDLAPTTPRLIRTSRVVNSLLNTLAYNPEGPEEGFLFWASWANHNGASVFSTQDAHGPVRRGIVLASCSTLGVLQEIGETNESLQLLTDLLDPPLQSAVCPEQTPGAGGTR
jgi:phospholipid/cholesterol/gamma-HCH transport system substrate-binding protein